MRRGYGVGDDLVDTDALQAPHLAGVGRNGQRPFLGERRELVGTVGEQVQTIGIDERRLLFRRRKRGLEALESHVIGPEPGAQHQGVGPLAGFHQGVGVVDVDEDRLRGGCLVDLAVGGIGSDPDDPGPGGEGTPGGEGRRAGHPEAAGDDEQVPEVALVGVGRSSRQAGARPGRRDHRGADLVGGHGRKADLGHHDAPATRAGRLEEEAELGESEADGDVGVDRGSRDLPRAEIDAGRSVNGDDGSAAGVDRLNDAGRSLARRARGPGPEKAVEDDGGAREDRSGVGSRRGRQLPQMSENGIGRPVSVSKRDHVAAPGGESAERYVGIAAVVPAPKRSRHATSRKETVDDERDGAAGVFHEQALRDAVLLLRPAVDLRHLGHTRQRQPLHAEQIAHRLNAQSR